MPYLAELDETATRDTVDVLLQRVELVSAKGQNYFVYLNLSQMGSLHCNMKFLLTKTTRGRFDVTNTSMYKWVLT